MNAFAKQEAHEKQLQAAEAARVQKQQGAPVAEALQLRYNDQEN